VAKSVYFSGPKGHPIRLNPWLIKLFLR